MKVNHHIARLSVVITGLAIGEKEGGGNGVGVAFLMRHYCMPPVFVLLF